MKKILIGIFLLATVSGSAQTFLYHPFPDSNAIWNYGYQLLYPQGGGSDEIGNYAFLMTGDTV